MSKEREGPAYFYRTGEDGKVEARVFQPDEEVGSGWVDNPADCKPKKRGPGRPPKNAEPDEA